MRIALNNFTGGEVSPSLNARYDLSRYKNSVQHMENFLPSVHGSVERRPGSVFLNDLGSDCVLYPFSFNVEPEHNYVIIIGHYNFRIAGPSGIIYGPKSAPWSLSHASQLSFAQVGDVVYFAHRSYPLHKLMRTGSYPDYYWNVSQVQLNVTLPTPVPPSVTFITANPVGLYYTLRYKIVAVDINGKESLPSYQGQTTGKHPSDWTVGDSATLIWFPVWGAFEYNIYREEAGYYGFIGVSQATSFIDNNIEADLSDTPKYDWQPFANGNNPSVVSFHQQRMVLASTVSQPQAFYMSRVGDFENFSKSRPLQEDDPVEYLIASGSIDDITWLASFGDLLVGTSGSEYKASGDGNSISATNINITAQSYWGSSKLFPIVIGNSVLHVQRHGSRVRDLFYSLEKDGYAGNDLSIMAPHLFDGYSLRQWTYQQTPYSTLWIVRSDGTLLALTYMKEHDIWGWSRHVTDGNYRSVVTISGVSSDTVYVVVERILDGVSKFFLERFDTRWQGSEGIANAFYVDSGITQQNDTATNIVTGLEHLEGRTVSILADGSPIEDLVVTEGQVIIPYAANVVHVGIKYSSVLSPLTVEGDIQTGTSLAQKRGIGQCSIRVQDSVGGKYGADMDNMYDFPFVPLAWGEAVAPFSGDIDFIPGGGQDSASTVWIVQDRPMPFTIQALIMDVDMGSM